MTATSSRPRGLRVNVTPTRSGIIGSSWSSRSPQVVDALATARLTRLIVKDEITRHVRDAVLDRLEPDPAHPSRLAYLIQCPWCASPYVAVAVVAARRFVPRLWGPVAAVLAFSEVTGFLVTRE